MTMKTTCSDFEDRLGDILANSLPREALQAAVDHLAECRRCRLLLEVAAGERDISPAGSGQSLVREILRKTSGPGCGRVREQICDFVDGTLHRDDAQVLAIHIENCGVCSELASTIRELSAVLPGMAELDPGASFTRQVLTATSRGEFSQPRRRDLLAGWWRSVVRRPRFAWEAAYAGALVFALAIGSPTLVTTAVSAPLDEVRGRTRQVWSAATEELTGLSAAAATGAAEAAGRLSQKVPTNPLRAGDSAAHLWQKGNRWVAALGELDFARIRDWGAGMLQAVRDFWKSLGFNRTFS
jgi:hypothetical protein